MAKINVQCFKCKTIYELEPEMKGVLVECAVCGTAFIVPELSTKFQSGVLRTNPYAAKKQEADSADGNEEDANLRTAVDINASTPDTSTTKLSTDTIKLTKTSRGMIPRIDDKFGVCKGRTIKHLKIDEELLDTVNKMSAKEAKEVPKPAVKPHSKWWPWGGGKKK
jgi:hypothetical protein